MRGLPKVFATKQDWLNAFDFVMAENDVNGKQELILRLKMLKESKTMLVPKAGAVPSIPPGSLEGTTASLQREDFEPVDDPASPFALSGLSDKKINEMIGRLE